MSDWCIFAFSRRITGPLRCQSIPESLLPPRSTMFWKPERLNAVTMSCPSRTHDEFIRPMNFSISSSDLCGTVQVHILTPNKLKATLEAAGSTPTCKWLGRPPLLEGRMSFHSDSSPPCMMTEYKEQFFLLMKTTLSEREWLLYVCKHF